MLLLESPSRGGGLRSLKADNAMFSRDRAAFLRRLLQIASSKQERWWYVRRVLGDEPSRLLLEKHLSAGEMRQLQALSRHAGDGPAAARRLRPALAAASEGTVQRSASRGGLRRARAAQGSSGRLSSLRSSRVVEDFLGSASPPESDSQRRVMEVLGLSAATDTSGDTGAADGAGSDGVVEEDDDEEWDREVAAVAARPSAAGTEPRPLTAARRRPCSALPQGARQLRDDPAGSPRPLPARPSSAAGARDPPAPGDQWVSLPPPGSVRQLASPTAFRGAVPIAAKLERMPYRGCHSPAEARRALPASPGVRSTLSAHRQRYRPPPGPSLKHPAPAAQPRPATAGAYRSTSSAPAGAGARRWEGRRPQSAQPRPAATRWTAEVAAVVDDVASREAAAGAAAEQERLLEMQPEPVRLAAGVRMEKADLPPRSAGAAWDRATNALKGLRGMVDNFDATFCGDQSGADDYTEAEAAIDLKWAVRDMESLPSEASGEVSEVPTPEEEKDDALSEEQRAERRAHRADCKREERRKLRHAERLPQGVREQPPSGEQPIVVTCAQLKPVQQRMPRVDGEKEPLPGRAVPEPCPPEERQMVLARRASLNGAANAFGSRVTEQGVRRMERWKPCFARLEGAEQNIHKLEQYWVQRNAQEELEHPPELTKEAKEAVLHDGLGRENDELAHFITSWAGEMERRLGVLITYEQIKLAARNIDFENKYTQIEEALLQPLEPAEDGPPAPCTTPPTQPSGLRRRASRRSSAASAAGERRESVAVGGLSFADEQVRARTGFQRVMVRVRAAIRLQSVWRGFLDRIVVGNIPNNITFFHSRDPRIRAVWVRCARSPPPKRPQRWLAQLVAKSLRAKITHDYVRAREGKAPLPFTDFLYEHLFESYGNMASVDEEVVALLTALDRVGGAVERGHGLYAVVTNFLMTFWDVRYSDCLSRALCLTHAEANKCEVNFINPTPELEVDISLTQACIKAVVRKLFADGIGRSRAASLSEAVVRRCADIERRRRGAIPKESKGVQPTQKEFLYALLISVDPDSLADAGYGNAPSPTTAE